MKLQFTKDLKGLATEFFTYARRNKYYFLILTLFTFLLHFRLFDSLMPGIDTENMINDPQGQYSAWLSIGRFGLILGKRLLGDYIFHPDFAVMTALFMLVLACIGGSFILLKMLSSVLSFNSFHEHLVTLFFDAVIVSHPILTEQLYFTLQCNIITLSFLLLEMALLAAHYWSREKNVLWLVISVVLLIIPFSSYQAMIPLFIVAAVAMALFCSLKGDESVKSQFFYVLRMALAFLIGFFIVWFISGIFSSGSSYLSDQVYWGEDTAIECVLRIFSHIYHACTGNGTFYFVEFGISCIVLLLIIIQRSMQIKNTSAALWQLFLLFCLFAAPFYMTLLQGTTPVMRSQLVLPFVSALTLCLCFLMVKKQKKLLGVILVCLCVSSVYHEATVTSSLYYTDAIRSQGDLELASSLLQDIREFTGEYEYSGSVVFLGRQKAASNSSCIQGIEVMGQSFFDWDTDVDPQYFYSSRRIVGFLNCTGASLSMPTVGEVAQATDLMSSMPCYPAEGSIVWCGDTLVIKLSEE